MTDPARPPLLSIILGYGPALVLPFAALVAWTAEPRWSVYALFAGRLWAAVILIFLAGVRRGLSFFTEGGPRAAQIATMMWLFLAGLAALVIPIGPALALLVLGYASVALLDPPAARRGEAPAHFARLRPPQMAVAVLGLVGLLARTLS